MVLLLCALANLAVVKGFMSDTGDVNVSVNFLQECVPSDNEDEDDDEVEDDEDDHGDDEDDDDDGGHHGRGHDDDDDEDDDHGNGGDDDQATPDPEHDLKGHKVNNSTGKIVNKSHNCKYQVGIASYKRFGNAVANQEIFDWKTQWILPNYTVPLQVALPDCAAQVYLFYDGVLFTMPPVGYGDRLLRTWKVNNSDRCQH